MYNESTVSESIISESIEDAFEATGNSLWMLNFKYLYLEISKSLPPRNSSFDGLSLEDIIGCEVICAAICHQINWDFLRHVVYEHTIQDCTWLSPINLSRITTTDVVKLIGSYNKPERIREKERCSLLRSVGKSLLSLEYNYTDIFISKKSSIKNPDEILGVLNRIKAFSGDPEGKKSQLLLQNLSEYPELSALSSYCKPAIDYHIIREFLRRGLVQPKNQTGHDFIFNSDVKRQEQTIAALRKVCSEAFYDLKWITNCDLTTINTIEWWIGRSVCLKECPDCKLEQKSSQWLKPSFSKCPFYDSCHAIQFDSRFLHIVEPTYTGNSY
jgi:hypothetical protein